jgi:hypothetical protein
LIQRVSAAYFGGALGAIVNSLAVWLLAEAELLSAVGISVHPSLTWAWLGKRMLWGSLWGLGFPLVQSLEKSAWKAGLLLSLAPTAAQLFYFYPQSGSGMAGLESGNLTPVLVLLANGLWGWIVAQTATRGNRT